MASITTSSYDGRYAKLTVTETSYNAITNTSVVHWVLDILGGSVNYYAAYNILAQVNGSTVYECTYQAWSSQTFPAAKGQVSGDITVAHNSDGTKSISFLVRAGWYSSSNTSQSSGTLGLTSLDRVAPTVGLSVVSTTANSITFRATSNYSVSFSVSCNGATKTGSGTSVDFTFTGLTANTSYSASVTGTRSVNNLSGTASVTGKTLGYSDNLAVTGFAVGGNTAVTVTYGLTVYSTFYHKLILYNSAGTQVLSKNLGALATGSSSSRTFQLTQAETQTIIKAITKAISDTFTFRMITYSDSGYSTEIGRADATATVTVTANSTTRPSVSVALSDASTDKPSVFSSIYVQLISKLRILTTSSGNLGATISSVAVNFNGQSTSGSDVTFSISASGTLPFSVVVTDSRGISTTVSGTVVVVAYGYPSCSVTFAKAEGSDDVTITATLNRSSVSSKNTASVTLTAENLAEGTSQTQTFTISPSSADSETVTWTVELEEVSSKTFRITADYNDAYTSGSIYVDTGLPVIVGRPNGNVEIPNGDLYLKGLILTETLFKVGYLGFLYTSSIIELTWYGTVRSERIGDKAHVYIDGIFTNPGYGDHTTYGNKFFGINLSSISALMGIEYTADDGVIGFWSDSNISEGSEIYNYTPVVVREKYGTGNALTVGRIYTTTGSAGSWPISQIPSGRLTLDIYLGVQL